MGGSTVPADDKLFLLGLEEHFATPEMQRLNGIRFPKGSPGSTSMTWAPTGFRAVDPPRAVKEKIAHKNAERLLKIGPF